MNGLRSSGRRWRSAVARALAAAAALPAVGCDDMRVGRPDALWLLWLVPLLLAFQIWTLRRRGRLLRRFADPRTLGRLTEGLSRGRQTLKAGLIVAGALFSILALAELEYGFTWEEVRRQGVDVVVALDVSDSMLARDVESGGRLSRLERAKREIADLLSLLEGDRIGLVAFAGVAFVECPLTLDYGAAALFLDALDSDLIPVKGTDLGAAIETSLEAFEGSSHPSKAILLITDGEDHGGRALKAAADAAAAGVRVFTIGIGRDEGSPIPAPGGGFLRDRGGELVLSRLDELTLQRIALDTGGIYVRSVTGDVDLEKIYSQGIKATLEDQELGSRRRQRWEDRFQWLLGLALAALMLEPLVVERLPARRRTALALLPVALAALGAGPAAASDPWKAYAEGAYEEALAGFAQRRVERPGEPELALDVGAAQYRLGDYEAAARAFAAAASAADAGLRAEALYNLGNTAYRAGRLEEAVEHFRRALDLAPGDQDAKFNLEFVREEIRRRQEQPQQPESGERSPGEGDDGSQDEDSQPSPRDEPQADGGEDAEGDGVPDGVEPEAPPGPEDAGEGAAGEGAAQDGPPLTPEEALRYLQALEEGRPALDRAATGQTTRSSKDW